MSEFSAMSVRPKKALHIGLDLDNTLINYDAVFALVGVELGFLSPEHQQMTKEEVRAYLGASAGGEAEWMRLQGQVYGRFIDRARLFEGVADFFGRLRSVAGVRFTIISHKTRYGHFDPHRIDLWIAAQDWLNKMGFFESAGFGFLPSEVVFEETREGKLARIAESACDLFIDDLLEVLRHPAFPPSTQPLWFAPAGVARASGDLTPYHNWTEVTEAVLAMLRAKPVPPGTGIDLGGRRQSG